MLNHPVAGMKHKILRWERSSLDDKSALEKPSRKTAYGFFRSPM